MRISGQESAYEAVRAWALHPVSHPPPGWTQLLRGGMAGFVQERHTPMGSAFPLPQPARLSISPLLTLVAAMIAEVCL